MKVVREICLKTAFPPKASLIVLFELHRGGRVNFDFSECTPNGAITLVWRVPVSLLQVNHLPISLLLLKLNTASPMQMLTFICVMRVH